MIDFLSGLYDGALLFNIVYGLGLEENRSLFCWFGDVIKLGGLLVLKDMFFGESGA